MKLTLETDRLLLRPFCEEDAEAMFYGWASDPEVTEYLTWPAHSDLAQTADVLRKWIKQYEKPERLNFAIVLKEENKLIGGIDVVGYLNGVNGTPVIGYNLAKPYWNNGYMTEACRCLLRYLFSKGYSEVRIDAAQENIGSNRVIQKCGGVFQRTEVHERPLKGDTMTVNHYLVPANAENEGAVI